MLDDCRGAGRRGWGTDAAAAGLAVCELVDPGGRVRSAETVDWRGVDLLADFDWVESDVRAAALAEARFGAGRDEPDFLYVSVGTGISHCLMVDGRARVGRARQRDRHRRAARRALVERARARAPHRARERAGRARRPGVRGRRGGRRARGSAACSPRSSTRSTRAR